MLREDLSNHLVHWTKGESEEEAFQTLLRICFDGSLLGGTRGLLGEGAIVSFTEAPYDKFHSKIVGEFKPFGIQFEKREIFALGGLPVIYQPREQLDFLDKSIWWRHVDFSMSNGTARRNYTWQREWRVKAEQIPLPIPSTLIVPTEEWAVKLQEAFSTENLWRGCEEQMDLGYFYTYRPVLSGHYTVLWLN